MLYVHNMYGTLYENSIQYTNTSYNITNISYYIAIHLHRRDLTQSLYN